LTRIGSFFTLKKKHFEEKCFEGRKEVEEGRMGRVLKEEVFEICEN
jgi:hypothetical protein